MKSRFEGTQVNLRRITPADADDLVRHIGDRDISRQTFIPYPYGRKDARRFIAWSQEQWRKKTAFPFSIEDRRTGRVVGGIGLHRINFLHKNAELGYWLNKRYRGRGVMTEAVHLILAFAFRELKFERVYGHVFVSNDASVRVLRRVGFKREGYLRRSYFHRRRWQDSHLYAILKQDWRPPTGKPTRPKARRSTASRTKTPRRIVTTRRTAPARRTVTARRSVPARRRA
ncbi:MAG TPA: GNAT family protein [Acidobacteriota bacterium]|nr:GNAT family protein [Acidobacteriota bacterium]